MLIIIVVTSCSDEHSETNRTSRPLFFSYTLSTLALITEYMYLYIRCMTAADITLWTRMARFPWSDRRVCVSTTTCTSSCWQRSHRTIKSCWRSDLCDPGRPAAKRSHSGSNNDKNAHFKMKSNVCRQVTRVTGWDTSRRWKHQTQIDPRKKTCLIVLVFSLDEPNFWNAESINLPGSWPLTSCPWPRAGKRQREERERETPRREPSNMVLIKTINAQ